MIKTLRYVDFMARPTKKDSERSKPRSFCLTDAQMRKVWHAMGLEPGEPDFSGWVRHLVMLAADKAIKQGRPASKLL